MLKKFIAVIFLLAGCATVVSDATRPTPQTSFEYVCERIVELEYSCEGLDEPIIVYSKIPQALRAYGVYVPGEQYVFVDPSGARVGVTEIHEVAHYVLYFNGVRDRCVSEQLARFIAGQDTPWRARYGCERNTENGT